ncbi:MAG: dihydroneopterin aldolase [Actinomycetota bacterium]
MTTIRLTGLEASGRHGANPGEREEAQKFVVDLEVGVDPEADELAATADYREIVDVARRVVEDRSLVLLETMAAEIAQTVAVLPGVQRVRVIVHKPRAAEHLGLSDVSAEASTA